MEVAKKSMAQMVQRTCPRGMLPRSCCSESEGIEFVLVLLERSKCLPAAASVPDELKTEISLHSNASHELKESAVHTVGQACAVLKPAIAGRYANTSILMLHRAVS